MVAFQIQIRRTYRYTFAPRLTPREKIEFEAIHILIKKMLHVSSKQNDAHF